MLDFRKRLIDSTLRKVLKRLHYPLEVMLTCVRWYVAYPLSLRQVEEMMQERGVFVDHSTVHRWAIKILPVLAAVFRRRKRQVGLSWRMDEQDHRAVKRVTQPMLGFKSFWSARILIAGIETMHMIRKGQLNCPDSTAISAAQQFYSLAVCHPGDSATLFGQSTLIVNYESKQT